MAGKVSPLPRARHGTRQTHAGPEYCKSQYEAGCSKQRDSHDVAPRLEEVGQHFSGAKHAIGFVSKHNDHAETGDEKRRLVDDEPSIVAEGR